MTGKVFECRTGECVRCCIEPILCIPVTLPDLYRACIYAKEMEGRFLTIPEAYDELCEGWVLLPNLEEPDWVSPMPKSKIPCPYVDSEKKLCTVHDTHQYVACRHYPEANFIDAEELVPILGKEVEFFESLECVKGASLTAERKKEVKELCELATDEIIITGRLLHNKEQPIMTATHEEGLAELKRKIRFLYKNEHIRTLIKNMDMHNIQERYMKLFGIESPDYTKRYVPTAAKAKTQITVSTMSSASPRIPKSKPCPCGSGHKYKKCCGKPS